MGYSSFKPNKEGLVISVYFFLTEKLCNNNNVDTEDKLAPRGTVATTVEENSLTFSRAFHRIIMNGCPLKG